MQYYTSESIQQEHYMDTTTYSKTDQQSPMSPTHWKIERDVWSYNLHQEIELLKHFLPMFPFAAIDTEFPGFLRYTQKGITNEELYDCLQFNVNRLSILQLGLTVFDENGNVGMTWEFNFKHFDHISDMNGVSSLDSFLKNKGFDFKILRSHGIEPEEFGRLFSPILRNGGIKRWITFHGFYDIAYFMKLVEIRFMPTSMAAFATTAQSLFGTVVDLKHMARYCYGFLNGDLGLKKLAKLLHVDRIGTAHFAGSDSLLTASVYAKMKTVFKLNEHLAEGFLYGLPHPIRADLQPPPVTFVDPSPPSRCLVSSFSQSPTLFVNDFLSIG